MTIDDALDFKPLVQALAWIIHDRLRIKMVKIRG
jgi:hypothetical protein